MKETVVIYCTKCRQKKPMEAEKKLWKGERSDRTGYEARCDCGTRCLRLGGCVSNGHGTTPAKIRDKRRRDRKRQRQYHDVIDNLPKIAGGLIDENEVF